MPSLLSRGLAPAKRACLLSRPPPKARPKRTCQGLRPLPAESLPSKSSVFHVNHFLFCNFSLNKSQSKLTDRQPRARHHKQLWEKVPGHPYHVRITPKGAATEALLRLTLCAASIPLRFLLAVRTLAWKLPRLGFAAQGSGPLGCLERGDEDMSLHLWASGSRRRVVDQA